MGAGRGVLALFPGLIQILCRVVCRNRGLGSSHWARGQQSGPADVLGRGRARYVHSQTLRQSPVSGDCPCSRVCTEPRAQA
jgi:hypothetical protein